MRLAACCLAVSLVLAGCGGSAESPARAELAGLPSMEDSTAQLQGAMDQIAAAARKAVPGLPLKVGGNEATVSCDSRYSDTGGKVYFAPNRVAATVAVKPGQWSAIEGAARAAAAGIGATDVQVTHNLPTHHDVWFRGPAGQAIEVAYQGNLVISGTTGCRLPAADKAS